MCGLHCLFVSYFYVYSAAAVAAAAAGDVFVCVVRFIRYMGRLTRSSRLLALDFIRFALRLSLELCECECECVCVCDFVWMPLHLFV